MFSVSVCAIGFIAKLNSVTMFSRWALMVLMWDSLMYCHIFLLRYFIYSTISSTGQTGWHGLDILYCLVYVSFPLFGLITDVRIGRHRTIITGIILCFSSMIIAGIGYVLNSFYPSKAILWPAYGMVHDNNSSVA